MTRTASTQTWLLAAVVLVALAIAYVWQDEPGYASWAQFIAASIGLALTVWVADRALNHERRSVNTAHQVVAGLAVTELARLGASINDAQPTELKTRHATLNELLIAGRSISIGSLAERNAEIHIQVLVDLSDALQVIDGLLSLTSWEALERTRATKEINEMADRIARLMDEQGVR